MSFDALSPRTLAFDVFDALETDTNPKMPMQLRSDVIFYQDPKAPLDEDFVQENAGPVFEQLVNAHFFITDYVTKTGEIDSDEELSAAGKAKRRTKIAEHTSTQVSAILFSGRHRTPKEGGEAGQRTRQDTLV